MKKMLFMITFFLSVVLIISGCEIYRIAYTKEIPEGNKTVEHQLENESRILNQTIFEEKISAELRYKIEKINQEIIHIKVYFTHGLNKSEEEKLTLEGIKFLTFRGINSWYVSIPANKIESFSKSELVKSVTEIKPKEKSQLFGDLIGDDPKDLERYGKDIGQNGIGKWALNEDGTADLRIIFFRDVNETIAKEIITKHEGNILDRGWPLYLKHGSLNDYLIRISIDKIPTLFEEDVIEKITEKSPPADVAQNLNK